MVYSNPLFINPEVAGILPDFFSPADVWLGQGEMGGASIHDYKPKGGPEMERGGGDDRQWHWLSAAVIF